MNRNRIWVSAAMALTLVVLLAWQLKRNAQIAECQTGGGAWTGSFCRPEPGRIIIQRDLRRS